MTVTANSAVAFSRRPSTGLAPIVWVGMAVTAMGVAHAAEGAVQIAREIWGTSPNGKSAASDTAAPGSATRASHEMAGFFLIAGSAYAAKLLHQALADVADVVGGIRGSRP
ncbi:hypothetical protein [Streptacidiphilus rugosus]|uniref:hypothetical protein n=1 Tax=Streptacidiphilus rugosus TaxID=405783 RepID=UPI000562A541|nr:hypothetical protein [Streptacidiphilus rugosus]